MKRFIVISVSIGAFYGILIYSLSLLAFGAGMSNFSGGHTDTRALENGVKTLLYLPAKISDALTDHFVGPFPSPAKDPDWTQEKQIALGQANKTKQNIEWATFICFSIILGCCVASIDLLKKRKTEQGAAANP